MSDAPMVQHLAALTITVIYPVYAYVRMRRIRPELLNDNSATRVRDYRETIGSLWGLTLLMLVVWSLGGGGPSDLGLREGRTVPTSVGLAITLVLFAAFQLYLRAFRRTPERVDALREACGAAEGTEWLPRRTREVRWWVLLALTAGVTEELLYRGFLIAYLEPAVGLVGAVMASSVAFGLAHAFQGPRGVAVTTLAGLLLAGIAWWTGGLWVVIAVHVTADLAIGQYAALGLGEARPATG